jgi:hypothetical protein
MTTTETTNGWHGAAQASADAELEAMAAARPPQMVTEVLPVALTEHEVADWARKAAAARTKVAELEDEKSRLMADLKAQITSAENDRDDALDIVESGTEDREVACREDFEFSTNTVTMTRLDTGETVRTRAMTYAERSPELPFDTLPRTFDATPSEPEDTDIEDPGALLGSDLPEVVGPRRRKKTAAS